LVYGSDPVIRGESILADEKKSGERTIGVVSSKAKMTLFKDDRAEDVGAIILTVLIVAVIVVMTM